MDDGSSSENYTLGISSTIFNDTVNATVGPGSSGATVVVPEYCGENLKAFGEVYRSIHGYSSLIVCLFGALANTLNLIVLTRKEMINPTNAILTGLALADLLNMVEYIPFTIYMNFLQDENGYKRKTWGWAVFVLTHSNFSQVCHTISIWLTLTLAVWRYIMVARPLKCKTLCTMDRAKWAILSAYVTSPILCIPIYFTFSIKGILPKTNPTSSPTVNSTVTASADTNFNSSTAIPPSTTPALSTENTKYVVDVSDLANEYPILMNANFWIYSVVIKIIPCILLTVVSLRLINSLMQAKKRKDKLLAKRTGNHAVPSPGGGRNHGRAGGDHESGGSDRTTRMLLAILLLFLITEFPQGLLSLFSGLLGDLFFKNCYIPLADLMDFAALLNSAINFILYCSMSKKFRDTFVQVFHLNRVLKLGRQHSGRNVGPRDRVNNHVASPSANRQLLGNSDDTQQTEQTFV